MKLPPDPDGQNNDRAQWAEAAVLAFIAETRSEPQTALYDLLCDLMHYCDREPSPFGESQEHTFSIALTRAEQHYHNETSGKGKQKR